MIVALVGQKGGTGKTTIAACLAAHWHQGKRKALLVDADPQRSALTWGEVARELEHPAPTVLAMGADLYRPEQLPALASGFKHVVIDCPPRLGKVQRAALMVADIAVVPCRPGPSDAWALSETLELIEEASITRPKLIARLLLAQADPRTALGRSAREDLADVAVEWMTTVIGLRISYPEALAQGLGVTQYEPKGTAAKEIADLATELEQLKRKE